MREILFKRIIDIVNSVGRVLNINIEYIDIVFSNDEIAICIEFPNISYDPEVAKAIKIIMQRLTELKVEDQGTDPPTFCIVL